MNATMKIKSFIVKGDSEKEAYLKGCKKFAKYMASKKYERISFTIERDTKRENAFIFSAFTTFNLGEEQRNFCKMCKEMHSSFFVNEEYNCSSCKLHSFFERTAQKMRISRSYYRHEMEE